MDATAAAPSDWLRPHGQRGNQQLHSTHNNNRPSRRRTTVLLRLVGGVALLGTASHSTSPKQHVPLLNNQTYYRPASQPYGGATNDAIDMTCAPSPPPARPSVCGATAAPLSHALTLSRALCRWDPRPTGAINGRGAHRAWREQATDEMTEAARAEIASGSFSIAAEFDKLISTDEELLEFWHDHRNERYRVQLDGGAVDYDLHDLLRSGGYPLCPNYYSPRRWVMGAGCEADNACTDHGASANGVLLQDRDRVATVFGPYPPSQAADNTPSPQEDSFYTWPDRVVGSPYKGEPALGFCRTFQTKYEATCCTIMLDEDIQEEYEESKQSIS